MAKQEKIYRRIALVFAGGTAISNKPGKGNVVEKAADVPFWLKHVDELRMVADFEPFFLLGEREGQMGPAEMVALGETVRTLYDDFDGIVILHHVQTVEYAAAALALMVQQPGKPIVFTGSPYTMQGAGTETRLTPVFADYQGLGIKANLLNALHVAASDIRGILFMFGNRLMAGEHVQRSMDAAMNPFTTIGTNTYGGVDFGLRLTAERAPRRSQKKPIFRIGLEPHVQAVAALPSFTLGFAGTRARDMKALVLRMDEKHALDSSLLASVQQLAKDALVVVHSAKNTKQQLPNGLVHVHSMTYPMAFVKTMWALAQTTDRAKAARLLQKNIVGEIVK